MSSIKCVSELKDCVSSDEVWNLMGSKIIHKKFNSRFDDDIILLPNSANNMCKINVGKDLIGLAFRVLIYLKENGEIGHKPNGSGLFEYANRLKSILVYLNTIGLVDMPSKVTSEILDQYIRKRQTENIRNKTIKLNLFKLYEWIQYGNKLPFFLRLNPDLFNSMKEYSHVSLLAQQEEKAYSNKIGGNMPLYPLNELSIIMQDAIHYVENYTNDSLHAAVLYKKYKSESKITHKVMVELIIKEYRVTKYKFTEPELKATQECCIKIVSKRWVKENNETSPVLGILNAVRKLQATSIIIILLLTAMRKQELNRMERYPTLLDTEQTELNESSLLRRLVYKTDTTSDGEPLSIPIPPIVGKALSALSRLSEIIDGKKDGIFNLSAIQEEKTENWSARINILITYYCKNLKIKKAPAPHQLRHLMAFLVSYINDNNGLELVMKMLGHKSYMMSQKYQGHFNLLTRKTLNMMASENPNLQNALKELEEIESKASVEKIIEEIEQDNPLVGPIARRISQFQGNLTDEAKDAITKTLRLMVEKGMLAVLQTPVCYCFHDLTNIDKMVCQRGYSQDSFAAKRVQPAACEGAVCPNSLYTRQNVEALKEQADTLIDQYPDELRERLESSTYYVDDGLHNTHINIIKQYEKSISKKG